MARARYLFGDMASGDVIAEISLQGVSMDKQLNDWGVFRGTTALDQSVELGVSNADIVEATTPGKCFVVCEVEDVPMWDGIVWTRTYDSEGKDLQLTARTYEAYMEHQFAAPFSRTDTEQLQIFVDLIDTMQANPFQNLNLQLPAGPFPVLQPRDLNIASYDYRNYLETISGIADGNDGFDWTIDTTRDPTSGAYIRTVRAGFPILGNPDAAPLSFDYPGNVTNYWRTDGITNAGTALYLLGTGEGSEMLVGVDIQFDLLENGFPGYDLAIARKDIGIQDNLDSMARQLGKQRRPPYTTVKFATKADEEPVFGGYGLGDACTISIIDARHPDSYTRTARIIAWTYKPSSDDGTAEAILTFEGDNLNE
jgi:hypothetical protein